MSNEPELSPFHLLAELKRSMLLGMIDCGCIGEQLTAFFYILARDHCMRKAEASTDPSVVPMTTVKDLLCSLNPEVKTSLTCFLARINPNEVSQLSKEAAMVNSNFFMRGNVSFLQFINITYTPTTEDLEDAFIRGVAFICRAGQAGVDIVIPVVLPENAVVGNVDTFAAPKIAKQGVWKNSEDFFRESNGISAPVSADDAQASQQQKLSIPGLRERISCLCVQVVNSPLNLKKANRFASPWGAGFFDKHVRPCMSVKHLLWSTAKSDLTHNWINEFCSLTVFHRITIPKESSDDAATQKQLDDDHQRLTDVISVLLHTAANGLYQIRNLADKLQAATLFSAAYKK
jgi:hypothetical protein